MQELKERRKFRRFNKKVDLIANLYQKKDTSISSHNIPLRTLNISRGGVMSVWPKGWECTTCKKCVFWIFNATCDLKNHNGNGESTKPLPVGCSLRLRSAGPHIQDIDAEIAWIRYSQEGDEYVLGFRFLNEPASFPF